MKLYNKILCVFSFYLFFSGIAYAGSALNSEWKTNFNNLHIVQNGKIINGTYDYAGGKITGVLEGRTIRGWWSETDDKQICGPGNQWSGPFVFRISSDGKSFQGNYGKCERGENDFSNLPADRQWNGTLSTGRMTLDVN